MPRKRVLDFDALAHDEVLIKALGPKARGVHLYEGLWCLAEDWGGYEYNPRIISKRMGAFNFSPKEVEKYHSILVELQKSLPFTAQNGQKVHWLKNFLSHQKLRNAALPRLPLPEWIDATIKKYKSGRKFAVYTVIPDRLTVAYRPASCSVHVAYSENDCSDKKQTQDTGHRTQDTKGRDAHELPSSETSSWATEKQRHMELCTSLAEHFNIEGGIDLASPSNGVFHPVRFIFNAKKSGIEAQVVTKALESMDRQKEKINNPGGWIVSVLKSEFQEHNYAEHLREHEKRKGEGGLESIKNTLGKGE